MAKSQQALFFSFLLPWSTLCFRELRLGLEDRQAVASSLANEACTYNNGAIEGMCACNGAKIKSYKKSGSAYDCKTTCDQLASDCLGVSSWPNYPGVWCVIHVAPTVQMPAGYMLAAEASGGTATCPVPNGGLSDKAWKCSPRECTGPTPAPASKPTPDPRTWPHAAELQNVVDKSKSFITVAQEKAEWLGNLSKLESVTSKLNSKGAKGQKALKMLQKAGKAAEYLTKALTVVDAFSGAAQVVGLLPIAESNEDKVNKMLEEIQKDIKVLREEVSQGFSDLRTHQHKLAEMIIEQAAATEYMDDVVYAIRQGKHVVDVHNDASVEQFLLDINKNLAKLQCAIMGITSDLCAKKQPLFEAKFERIKDLFPAGGKHNDVPLMLEMLMALSMRFNDLISYQVEAIEVISKFMIKLKQLGRESLAKQFANGAKVLLESLRHQQMKNDPMLKAEFRATVAYAFTGDWDGNQQNDCRNFVSALCKNLGAHVAGISGRFVDVLLKPGLTAESHLQAQLRKIAPNTQFKLDELSNFGYICWERAEQAVCEKQGKSNCARFVPLYTQKVEWLKGRKALSDVRAQKYLEMAKTFAEADYYQVKYHQEKKTHWADFTGNAGKYEWNMFKKLEKQGKALAKELDESLI